MYTLMYETYARMWDCHKCLWFISIIAVKEIDLKTAGWDSSKHKQQTNIEHHLQKKDRKKTAGSVSNAVLVLPTWNQQIQLESFQSRRWCSICQWTHLPGSTEDQQERQYPWNHWDTPSGIKMLPTDNRQDEIADPMTHSGVQMSIDCTLRIYSEPLNVYLLPPIVNVMSGRESILLQSTWYCNTE